MSRVRPLEGPHYGGLVHEVGAVTSQQGPHLPADSGHHSVMWTVNIRAVNEPSRSFTVPLEDSV